MKNHGFLYIICAMFLLASASCATGSGKRGDVVYYLVTRVIDGDTFWIDDGTATGQKVRLIGVDTPETVHPDKEVEEYGKDASDHLDWLLTGNEVRLEYDVDTLDLYSRTLAYVYLRNGTFVNAELVKNGYARVSTIPPNVRFAETFIKLERQARRGKKGLWATE